MYWVAAAYESCLQRLAESGAATVKAVLEVVPLVLHLGIVLKLEVCLGMEEAGLDILGDKVVENQCVHAFALIFGLYGYQQKVDSIGMAHEGAQHMPPSEREEASARLL